MKTIDDNFPDPLPALRRAAKEALQIAKEKGTACWVWKDGKIVDLNAGRKKKRRKSSGKKA